jgi:hypothetical protein
MHYSNSLKNMCVLPIGGWVQARPDPISVLVLLRICKLKFFQRLFFAHFPEAPLKLNPRFLRHPFALAVCFLQYNGAAFKHP